MVLLKLEMSVLCLIWVMRVGRNMTVNSPGEEYFRAGTFVLWLLLAVLVILDMWF